MQFSRFSDFIDMGGYGFYVWLSFGAGALLLTLLIISSKVGHRKVIKQIAQRKQREDILRKARATKTQQTATHNPNLKEEIR